MAAAANALLQPSPESNFSGFCCPSFQCFFAIIGDDGGGGGVSIHEVMSSNGTNAESAFLCNDSIDRARCPFSQKCSSFSHV